MRNEKNVPKCCFSFSWYRTKWEKQHNGPFFVFLIPYWMWHAKHSMHENSFFAHRVSIFVLAIHVENAIHSSFFVFRVQQECEKRYGKPCVDFRTAYGKRKTVVFRFSDFVRREKNELSVHTRTWRRRPPSPGYIMQQREKINNKLFILTHKCDNIILFGLLVQVLYTRLYNLYFTRYTSQTFDTTLQINTII